VIITGSLLETYPPAVVERELHFAGIRWFELGMSAEPLRDALRDHAVKLAALKLREHLILPALVTPASPA
jgi:hypothetical protein